MWLGRLAEQVIKRRSVRPSYNEETPSCSCGRMVNFHVMVDISSSGPTPVKVGVYHGCCFSCEVPCVKPLQEGKIGC